MVRRWSVEPGNKGTEPRRATVSSPTRAISIIIDMRWSTELPFEKAWTSRSPSGHNPVNPSLHLGEPLRGQCHETSWTVLALGELPLITATRNVISLGPETLLNLHQTPLPWMTSFSTTWGAHYQPTASWKGKPQIPQRMMMAGDMERKTTHPNLGQ